ncbi:FAD-dependent oxidoreductase [Erwinia sp. AnSW2-5]|uniref:oxidoreductase n=1 Tax=Erwinia sp. AnSW2-5 TaxID=3367692 RepID=UPI00385B9941
MNGYRHLFTPITINGMRLKNRIIMPPMGTNFAGLNGEVSEQQLDYYALRAKGGTALITIENVCIDFPFATNGTTQLRIDNDQYIPGLFRLTERLHQHGACVSVQLNHAGASAYAARLDQQQPVSSSTQPSKKNGNIPRSLSVEEIYQVVEKFGDAAQRARQAGFDCVEIHAGHSYLLCQFLSPIYNQRDDEFGGSVENRARIVRLVVDKVREKVGPRFPISLRFSMDDFVEGGNHPEEMLALLEHCQQNVDMLNVSAALNDTLQFQIDQMDLPDGWKRYLSRDVRQRFGKPTVIAGNIRNPMIAEDILASGDADLLAIGRGLIAEPAWVNKVQNGQEHLMRHCISCNIGCADHRIARSRPIRCSINPDILHGDAYQQRHISHPLKVVVIGGGTAGMEAACTAAEVGCQTWLLEAQPQLGGLARDIARLPEKQRIAGFPLFMERRLRALDNLEVITGKRAGVADIAALQPDLVVNATGSTPLLPPINGLMDFIDRPGSRVFSITGLLSGIDHFTDTAGKRVVVVGGGAVGLDVSEYFAKRGAQVSLVEMLDAPGRDLDLITKSSMLAMLDEHRVALWMQTQLMAVHGDHFSVKKGDALHDLPFDYGFVCLGMRANQQGLDALQQWATNEQVRLMNIGDSVMARRIIDGIREGHDVLTTLEDMGCLA